MRAGRLRPSGLILLALFVVSVSITTINAQATRYVDDDCVPPGTGTSLDPYCKIQDAICELDGSGGGKVMVRPGTYFESLRMFGGVSVVSTDGAAVTTIDATNQMCIDANCDPRVDTSSCSAVVYGSGSTPADRLEGFTITGGAGLERNPGTNDFVAGGGIFIFASSPTITRNEIVGNILDHPTINRFYGGAIYVEGRNSTDIAEPIITQNLIEANIADPPNGTGGGSNKSYGIGAGLYVGGFAAGTIADNTIRNNSAGDRAKDRQLAVGGGIVVYSYNVEPVFTRNLIQGNYAADFGGGLRMGVLYDGPTSLASLALIENNLFEYNDALDGGGAHTRTSRARFRNDTFTDHTIQSYGAGLYIGPTDNATDIVTLVNNLIVFNTTDMYLGDGGGIYVHRDGDPSVTYNDLYGNSPENVGGFANDSTYINKDGNISVDPLFVNRAAVDRNLHLQSTSPVIDVGDNAQAGGAYDLDGNDRVVDGDNDTIAVVDMGAYEYSADTDGDGVPDASDNCPNDPNPGQEDTDGDGLGDACDDDDDNDGVLDVSDNCPLDANPGQEDADADSQGDVCDPCPFDPDDDVDGDGVCGDVDNCPVDANPAQTDTDGDGQGDVCDTDDDDDGVLDGADNCPLDANPGQEDNDADGQGDVCDDDDDNDGVLDGADNCPLDANAGQEDADADGLGDVCDACPNDPDNDVDGDGVCGDVDNCPSDANAGQTDTDADGQGDVCDTDDDNDGCLDVDDANPLVASGDPDADGLADDCDNCPGDANPAQTDTDADGQGDVCDADDDNDGCLDVDDANPLVASGDTDADGLADDCDACPNDPDNDVDVDGVCGDVDNCPADANAGQEDNDADGLGDVCDADDDNDGVGDGVDNCPLTANAGQEDADADGLGDVCDACPNDADNDLDGDGVCGDVDNCPADANPAQLDADTDGLGDACDACPDDPDNDVDVDGVCGDVDNCPADANPGQEDNDADGQGDACDTDDDNDGVLDAGDNCPLTANPAQTDTDADGLGDVCDTDDDNDGVDDGADNCPLDANPAQTDTDADGQGDACDTDDDNDGVLDGADNCPLTANAAQTDSDADGLGDACDPCPLDAGNDADADGVCGDVDNCPADANPGQQDSDGDGPGDACDADDDNDGALDVSDCAPFNASVSSEPGPIGDTLRLSVDGVGAAVLTWQRGEPQGRVSNVYRGTIDGAWAYNETCFDAENPGTESSDGESPLPGQAFYYFVSSKNVCAESRMGQDNQGGAMTDLYPSSPCADQNGDTDGDGVPDVEDNCVDVANPGQQDADMDFVGDACDACAGDPVNDVDNDGICGDVDNCPNDPNPGQEDNDGDGLGDVCDTDDDNDGVEDGADNCPSDANPAQTDTDGDGQGDACDTCRNDPDNDIDTDGVCGDVDNCPLSANAGQEDADGDGQGDVCDADDDNDGVLDVSDCEPLNASVSQAAGPVGATLFVSKDGGGGAMLSWQKGEQGFVSNVYRGTIVGSSWTYDETCFDPENPGTESTDGENPPAGQGFYYFVSGDNVCGESRMGQDNQGGTQNDLFPSSPCAAQNLDTDTDGVSDVEDNCPSDTNSGQEDADLDFQGDVCDPCPNDPGDTC